MAEARTRARGELEGEILRILWESPRPLSAKDVQAVFTGHTPAYATLMTALDRLQRKGHVIRIGESPRKVRFRAAHSEDEHVSAAMLAALDDVGDRQAALLRFAGNLNAEDVEVLRAALAEEPRRRRTGR